MWLRHPWIAHLAAKLASSPQLTPSARARIALFSRPIIPKESAMGLPKEQKFFSFNVITLSLSYDNEVYYLPALS